MPNRIIREGILTSDRIETLDAAAEVFYRRLMSKVDDFGLYDARPSILRSSLFPLRIDRVREADISRWIAACEKAGLIALYTHDSKPFMQMLDTRWQTRAEAKYPLPKADGCKHLQSTENSCAQEISVAPVFGVGVGVGVEDVKGEARKRATPPNCPSDVEPQVWTDWLALRKAKRAPVTATVVDGAVAESEKAGLTLEAFLRVWCARGSQGLLADWLKPHERASQARPAKTFRELDEERAAEKFHAMTGGVLRKPAIDQGAINVDAIGLD
jgi:hypothetical protein